MSDRNSIPLDPGSPDDPGDRARDLQCHVCGDFYPPEQIAYQYAKVSDVNRQCRKCDHLYRTNFEPNIKDWLALS